MSSFVSTKSQKKTSKKGAKKKLKEEDVNSSSQQQSSQQQEKSKKKKGKISAEEEGGIVKVKTSEINDATRVRNRKLVEEVVHNTSPAMNHEFMANSLRKFGAEVSKKASYSTVVSILILAWLNMIY